MLNLDFCPGRGLGKQCSHPHTIKAKTITKLQNNYHPELSENQAVWQSNNQELKSHSFRRVGGAEMQRCRDMETWNRLVPYPWVVG